MPDQRKEAEAKAQLQKYGLLGAVETNVIVAVSQLLDEVQKFADFLDWIIEKGNLDDFRKATKLPAHFALTKTNGFSISRLMI